MALTPKQEKFAMVYVETGNASEAYRQAYSTKRMKPESVGREAKACLDHPKISSRVAELRAEVAREAKLDAVWLLKELKRQYDKADSNDRDTSALKALEIMGKHVDIQAFKDRLEVDVNDPSSVLAAARKRVEEEKETRH